MGRRLRASVDPPKRPNGPVVVKVKPDAEVWQRAMVLADQDYRRLVAIDDATVLVLNSRERAQEVRDGR